MPVTLDSTTPAEEKDEWRTDPVLFQLCNLEFNFNLDAAATPENALCDYYFTEDDNALTQEWGPLHSMTPVPAEDIAGWARLFEDTKVRTVAKIKLKEQTSNVWCNPPFSLKHEFLKKGVEEFKKGTNSCFLVPGDAPEADWWVNAIYDIDFPVGPGLYQAARSHVRILKPRVNYYTPDGLHKKGNNRPSALIIMGWDRPQGIYTWYWKREAILRGLLTEITPVAEKLADKNSIDLSEVKGSGAGGKIVVDDIKKLI